MKTQVIVKFGVPGFHRWDGAPEGVAYLRAVHRHIFTFRVCCSVQHLDRQVEFHTLQALCMRDIGASYETLPGDAEGYMFGSRSCEVLARELGENLRTSGLRIAWVECFEDDENGSRVEWDGTEPAGPS